VKGKEGREEEKRREKGEGKLVEKKRETKMTEGLKIRENDSEELISHSSKEAHN
jgi:hypothetical protein